MESSEVRRAFANFAGEKRYVEFIRALNDAPLALTGLRFWQEDLWSEFVKADTRWPADFAAVREAFRVCELHGCELAQDAVQAPPGQIQRHHTQSPDAGIQYIPPAFFKSFPYPGWGVDPELWTGAVTRIMEIWYCPECRRLRAIWEAEYDKTGRARGNFDP